MKPYIQCACDVIVATVWNHGTHRAWIFGTYVDLSNQAKADVEAGIKQQTARQEAPRNTAELHWVSDRVGQSSCRTDKGAVKLIRTAPG